jgi:hypothetical protein
MAGVVKPEAKYKVGDPITVKISFSAEVPKGDAPPWKACSSSRTKPVRTNLAPRC